MALSRFTLDELPSTPWKNGGGRTREIVCWPPGAGLEDFEWRCSVASIEADGAFSAFPGVDRQIVLLSGDGVQLHGDGVAHRLDTPLQPFAFAGDVALTCARLGGSSTDFNLMTRRGSWRTALTMHDSAVRIAGSPHGLLLAISGTWRIGVAAPLAAGQGVWWTQAQSPAEAVPDEGADARLIAIRLRPL